MVFVFADLELDLSLFVSAATAVVGSGAAGTDAVTGEGAERAMTLSATGVRRPIFSWYSAPVFQQVR